MRDFVMGLFSQYMEFAKINPVIGGVLALWGAGVATIFTRYLPNMIRTVILKQFTMSVTLHNQDDLFYNFIEWYERIGFSLKSRTLRAMSGKSSSVGPRISIGYGTHYFWCGMRLYWAQRVQEPTQMGTVRESITISTLGRTQKSIRGMLNQCIPIRSRDLTRVFVFRDYWCMVSEQSARAMETIFIPQRDKDKLIDVISKFANNRPFYNRTGIPYRLGLAFHGVPGTGKTSMARALCHHLERDLYVLDMAKLDNDKLMEAFNSLPNCCFVLIEDIDTYSHCTKRVAQGNALPNLPNGDAGVIKAVQELSGITLSGVLNAIDGAVATSDRILVVTTNHFEKLDFALKRKGRIDHDIHFDYMDGETVRAMMMQTYPDFELPATFEIPQNITPVDLQSVILTYPNDPQKVLDELRTSKMCGPTGELEMQSQSSPERPARAIGK